MVSSLEHSLEDIENDLVNLWWFPLKENDTEETNSKIISSSYNYNPNCNSYQIPEFGQVS